MSWKVYVDTREAFMRDELAIHMAVVTHDTTDVVTPMDLVLERKNEPVVTPAALHIDRDLARALYDGLGQALGIHTPDARLAAEVLAREQKRVDKMIDHLTDR